MWNCIYDIITLLGRMNWFGSDLNDHLILFDFVYDANLELYNNKRR